MKDGTREDYALLEELEHDFAAGLPSRIMRAMAELDESLSGYQVTRLEHSLISATMAERDGADADWVVAALIHDIGDGLAPYNHDSLAAAIAAPYVRDECTWVLRTHGIFQLFYYGHHVGADQHARNKYRDHPFYESGALFTERWDQSAFDPDYPFQPLEHFRPVVEEVFTRKAWDERNIRTGVRVPMVPGRA
ncbi:MAG: peptidase [Rhizobiales bacterium]|nr:peptidase [Hyphomicrobiales bacterium]